MKISLELQHEHSIPSGVLGFDLGPDESAAYAAGMDGAIYQCDLESGETQALFQHGSGYASQTQVDSHRNRLICSGYDGRVTWFDLDSHRLIREIQAHDFWSWRMKLSPDNRWIASSTGQYLPGGYDYKPAPAKATVRVFDAETGKPRQAFDFLPPALSVAWAPDSAQLAAGNLMGDFSVWSLSNAQQLATWRTDLLTSWGIIKSHHYVGGVYDIAFTADGQHVIGCGMGEMRDPMAGNGKQFWVRYDPTVGKDSETTISDSDQGRGLMECLAISPDGTQFVMAGRLAQGSWNVALFESSSGKLLASVDNKTRITGAKFSKDARRVYLSGAKSQGEKKDGKWRDFGRVFAYKISTSEES